MEYFLANLDIGRKNSLIYDNRPFKSIQEHDFAIMKNWNDTVGKDDDVYILGGISWLPKRETVEYFQGLNGRKHLLRGEHDHILLREAEVRACFVEIRDYKELIVGHRGVVLSSSPILFFANYRKGWYHFYGDLRKNYEENAMRKFCEQISDITGQPHNMLNVGVMQEWMDYRPRTFGELERKLQELYRKNRRKSA